MPSVATAKPPFLSPLVRRIAMFAGSALAIGGTGYVTTVERVFLPTPYVPYVQSSAFYEAIPTDSGARAGRRLDEVRPGQNVVKVTRYCLRPRRSITDTRELRWITITGDGLGLVMGAYNVELRDDDRC